MRHDDRPHTDAERERIARAERALAREDARARRGADLVHVGLMIHVLAVIGTAVVAAGVTDGAGGEVPAHVRWALVALLEAAIVLSILAANRFVRVLVIWASAWSLLGGATMLALSRLPAAAAVAEQVPLVPLGLLTVTGAAGALLATATPWAHAWFRARHETAAARRARLLAPTGRAPHVGP